MSLWFGESWDAPVCDPDTRAATPVGQPCVDCEREIAAGDQGFLMAYSHGGATTQIAYHRVCFLRTIIPCEQWTDEMLESLPQFWLEHLREHHGMTL